MISQFSFEHKESLSSEEQKILQDGISLHAKEVKGFPPMQSLAVLLRNEEKELMGGACGIAYYGCLYVDTLWVRKEWRKQGWGSKILTKIEEDGRKKGCSFATLNTMDWEALPFYQRLGYEVEWIREGYEGGSKMYLLRKAL